jgi:pilus assembly protein CpaC
MRSITAALLISFMIIVIAPSAHADETVMIQVNHGMLLKVSNVERVVVAAPDIADVNIITRSQLMLVAKKVGETTISVWDARGYTAYRVVIAGAPATDIIKALGEVLREPSVVVKVVGDAIVLEGSVKTSVDKARAESIASAFGRKVINVLRVEQVTPPPPSTTQVLEAQVLDALKGLPVVIKVIRNSSNEDTILIEGTVANQAELTRLETIVKALVKNAVLLVRVRDPRQIRVDATFVEIDRQALQQMGVEWGGGSPATTPAPGAPVLAPSITDPFAFHFGFFDPSNPFTPLQVLVARLRLLESRGVARVLSNPRLVVLEGRPGKLVVGGELPVPIVGADRTVTVQFKEFGIRLEFCVNSILRKQNDQLDCVRGQEFGTGDGVTMDLRTEVSSLDFANAIVAAGFLIPTIKKREVQTMIIMRPGEFLVLGGLIQREVSQNVSRIPLLGDLPILGALFRSTRFQRGETELVIFVSPSVVAPTREQPAVPAEPSPVPSPAP